MVSASRLVTAVVVASTLWSAVAHPGEHHDHESVKREIREQDYFSNKAARSLQQCASTVNARALNERAIARRAATAEKLRKHRGIQPDGAFLHRRDLTQLEQFETVKHNMTGSVDPSDLSNLFSANTSCVLTPELTIGPYYVLGKLVRSDVTEDQPGIPLHLEMQFVDIATCEPIPDLLIDIWAANSTGVYSGIDSEGGLNSTYMRGLQPTDSDGVAEFDTIFPGHYQGRATHQHLVVHGNATLLSNGSYAGGTFAHIGQLFFDEVLREAVEATYPYSENTQSVTTNDEDMWAPSGADNDYDPFPEYVYLSDDITDGLLMWISIGIDTTANHTSDASYAAYLAADGGHNSGNTLGGPMPGGGNMTGNGTMPSGAIPSGGPPSDMPGSASVPASSAADSSGIDNAATSAVSSLYTSTKPSNGPSTSSASYELNASGTLVSLSTSRGQMPAAPSSAHGYDSASNGRVSTLPSHSRDQEDNATPACGVGYKTVGAAQESADSRSYNAKKMFGGAARRL